MDPMGLVLGLFGCDLSNTLHRRSSDDDDHNHYDLNSDHKAA